MTQYAKEFNKISAQKDDATELYQKHTVAMNIVLAMLDSTPWNYYQRLLHLTSLLGSQEDAIVGMIDLKNQINAFINLGYMHSNPDISQSAKLRIQEMCVDVDAITLSLELKHQFDKNNFWQNIIFQIDNTINKLYLM